MAAEKPEKAALDLGDGFDAAPAKSSKVKLIGVILIVMLLEAGVFYFIAGSGSAQAIDSGEDQEQEEVQDDTLEVPIEKFTCTNSQAHPGATIHLTIEMAAIIAEKQLQTFQESVTKTHKARIRAAILKVLRSASSEDLKDADYRNIKRLVREEINKVLHKSVVIDIAISDFSKTEQ